MSDLGREQYEAYRDKAQGRSLATGDRLPDWEGLPAVIRAAWGAAASVSDHPRTMTEINGVTASTCQLGAQDADHTALRFVWHHILPQVCGGKSVTSNLAELCDNCHYAVHAMMWDMAHGAKPSEHGTDGQFNLAATGYQLAVKAGTAGKIPKESAG
jgi:hypothetical protein